MLGIINSFESMGLVDGPGVRFVVFMNGCPLRCLYCHNPETWAGGGVYEMTPEQLLKKIKRFKPYFGRKGGVTFSGGEPLNQPEFLLECLKLLKAEGIHTCLDTSGHADNYEEILEYVDLVILDIKAISPKDYKELTGQELSKTKKFLKYCQDHDKKLWLRQVIVPGINDTEDNIERLRDYIAPLKNVEKVELLPYHTMAKKKYKDLKIDYRLEGVSAMDKSKCKQFEKWLVAELKRLGTLK